MDARFDELLERSGWIRELARHLTADVHRADDLVQDAWVAALTRPPAKSVSLKGWMARVLRNRAIEERRRAEHRRARERGVGGREPEPSADVLLERLDLQREIADAVRELDEPYRSTLLLRYFEGLTPKEIARRTDEPVRTVHSRLNRGLGRLRRRLEPPDERAHAAWLAGLVALGDAGRGGSTSIGAWIVGLKIKVACGLALAAGVGTIWQLDWKHAEVVSVAPTDAVAEAAAPREEVFGQRTELAPDRESDEPGAGAQPAQFGGEGEPPFGPPSPRATCRGRVLGLDGVGRAGVPVVFAPFGQPGNGEPVVSGPGGWFEFVDAPRAGQIDAVGIEWATVFQPRILEGQEDLPVLVVAPAIALEGVVVDDLGAPVADAWVGLEVPGDLRAGLDAIVDESHTREWRTQTGPDGRFAFENAPAIDGARLTARHPHYAETEQASPTEDAFELALVVERSAATAALTGTVVDGEGAAVPRAAVLLGRSSTYADEAGVFSLYVERDDEARVLEVCARGFLPLAIEGRIGVGVEHAFADPLVVVLDRPAAELRGRVVDAEGNPVAGIAVWTPDEETFGSFPYDPDDPESWSLDRTVEGIARGELWSSEVTTDDDGRFALKGVQRRPYVVAAFDHERFTFGASVPTMPGELVEVRLAAAAPRVDLTGRVTSLSGVPLEDVELRFSRSVAYEARERHVDEEHGGYEAQTDAQGRFAVSGLPGCATTLHVGGGGLAASFDRAIDPVETSHIELALPLLCRLQVILPDDLEATHFHVLDAAGEEVALRQKHGWSESASRRIDLAQGRSEVLRTTEEARTLVLFDGDTEIVRMPLELDPDELTVVRP